ncbi:MAG: hypothetical protein ABFS56_27165 [Pseudomonadota bacterium]
MSVYHTGIDPKKGKWKVYNVSVGALSTEFTQHVTPPKVVDLSNWTSKINLGLLADIFLPVQPSSGQCMLIALYKLSHQTTNNLRNTPSFLKKRGLVRATQGNMRILGYDVRHQWRQARHALGVVPQELAIDPFFTVREILRLQSGYFGHGRENQAWIDELLETI